MQNINYNSFSKLIKIKPKSIVQSKLLGVYKTAFKGSGQDYHQSRHYEEGDDARYLDSRLTARNIELYTKEFTEERQNEVILLIDISNSILTNLKLYNKMSDFISTLYFIADLVHKSNDKLGFIAFADRIIEYETPNRNYTSIIKLKKLFSSESIGKTNISNALDFLYKNFRRNSLVFLISDFFDTNFYEKLSLVSQKFDIILINSVINDNVNFDGYLNVIDSETLHYDIVKASELNYTHFLNQIQEIAKKNNFDYIEIDNFNSFLVEFYNLMIRRSKLR